MKKHKCVDCCDNPKCCSGHRDYEKEINAAVEALGLWFQSQEIEPEDAVVVMSATIATIIRMHNKDPQVIKKGKSLVARMIRDF